MHTVAHVGGPILGPGVPNVLIGKMPAVVMGDMCTCVGPPDSIIKGSTGVMIGGRPAARMGDLTIHGGSIVFGFPTVLIGEVGAPSTVNLAVSPVTVMVGPVVIPPIIFQNMPPASAAIADQVVTMQNAAEEGIPFCEVCSENTGSPEVAEETENQEEEPQPEISKCYFTDLSGNEISEANIEDEVIFVIESQNVAGETVTIDLSEDGKNYQYNGSPLTNNQLTVSINSDVEKIRLVIID